MSDKRKEPGKIVSNEAIVGKPYLDIDRVINEGIRASSNHKKRNM